MKANVRWLVAVAVGAFAAGQSAKAADPAPTAITIPGLDCAGCAKKVAVKLAAVPGVSKAEPDLATKTIKVTPKANTAVSPKALWEAVEKAEQTPTKLVGPGGTFTAKPQS
jgi:copper chaperone CopZ